MFQFHDGAIRSVADRLIREELISFNSTMVRLEVCPAMK